MKLEYPDCDGTGLKVGQTVYSTQSYHQGAVFTAVIFSLHPKREGIIEVEHFDGVFQCASSLWSVKPTQSGDPYVINDPLAFAFSAEELAQVMSALVRQGGCETILKRMSKRLEGRAKLQKELDDREARASAAGVVG